MVEQPAKVMRIGTMIKQLLEEVRAAPLDEASRSRLKRDPRELDQGAGGRAWPRSCARSCSGCRCRSPRTPPRRTPSCGSRRPSSSAGWRGCSTASRRRCSPSRWPRARSWSRCAAACRRVPGRASSPRAGWAAARASTCSRPHHRACGRCHRPPESSVPAGTLAGGSDRDHRRRPGRGRGVRAGPLAADARAAQLAARVRRPRRRAGGSVRCGATWAGRTSSSATGARCSGRCGSASAWASSPPRWASSTARCSASHRDVPALRRHRAC